MRSKRARQYGSLDYPNDASRNDVPFKIEWSERKSSPEPKFRVSRERSTSIDNLRKEKRGKRLTVSKMLKKKSNRTHSKVGLDTEKKDDSMIQSLLKNKKRTLTVPREPRLLLKEKLGERKYSNVGPKVAKEVECVPAKPTKTLSAKKTLTEPVSPNLVTKQKFGDRRYSNVGLQNEPILPDEKPNVDWAKRKPTVPKTPMLSFSIQDPKKRDARREVKDRQSSAPIVFKARPAPKFPNPTIHKSKISVRPLTIPKPFRLATNERALSFSRESSSTFSIESSSMSNRSEKTGANNNEVSAAFRARPVPNFSRQSMPARPVSARSLTVPKPFRFASNERALSFSRESSSTFSRESSSMSNRSENKEDMPSSSTFRARPVPNFSRQSMPTGTVSARSLTIPKPFHLTTNNRTNSPRKSKGSVIVAEVASEDKFENDTAEKKMRESSCTFKARPVPNFSKLYTHQKINSMRQLTVPKPFHLTGRTLSPRRSRDRFPENGVDPGTGNIQVIEDKFVFRARAMPSFSRNPNNHRKALAKRALTVPVPFRLVTTDRANTPRRQSMVSKLNIDESQGYSPTTRRTLTFPKPFRMMTEKRANRKSSSSSTKLDGMNLPLPPPETRRVYKDGNLTASHPFRLRSMESSNGSQINKQKNRVTNEKRLEASRKRESLVRRQITIPKPFGLTSTNRKQSKGSETKEKLEFRARPMPFYKISRQQPSTSKRPLTSPKPFRLRTAERAKHDDHSDLVEKLNLRSKQNAVARAEQFDDTQNTVDRLMEMSSSFLSMDQTNENLSASGTIHSDDDMEYAHERQDPLMGISSSLISTDPAIENVSASGTLHCDDDVSFSNTE